MIGLGQAGPDWVDRIKQSLLKWWHNTPISPRIILVPKVPDQYFWLIGRIQYMQNYRELADNHGQSPGKVWHNRLSLRESGTEKMIGYFFKHVQKQYSRSKLIGLRSPWSFKGPLKIFLSRPPSAAFVYSLGLSFTLGSFRIHSAVICRGYCVRCQQLDIVLY